MPRKRRKLTQVDIRLVFDADDPVDMMMQRMLSEHSVRGRSEWIKLMCVKGFQSYVGMAPSARTMELVRLTLRDSVQRRGSRIKRAPDEPRRVAAVRKAPLTQVPTEGPRPKRVPATSLNQDISQPSPSAQRQLVVERPAQIVPVSVPSIEEAPVSAFPIQERELAVAPPAPARQSSDLPRSGTEVTIKKRASIALRGLL